MSDDEPVESLAGQVGAALEPLVTDNEFAFVTLMRIRWADDPDAEAQRVADECVATVKPLLDALRPWLPWIREWNERMGA